MNLVVSGVEGFYRITVERPSRQRKRQLDPVPARALGWNSLVGVGIMTSSVVAAKKDAAKVLSGETIEPSHGVFKAIVTFAAEVEK
jgi:hypothetical protein